MKTSLIVLAVVIVIGGGYYWYSQQTSTDTPEPVQGKLDINAICDGALAYMTFPDGASAEAFLAECKAGERPEVIERYKADMNLGDGAAY